MTDETCCRVLNTYIWDISSASKEANTKSDHFFGIFILILLIHC